MSSFPCFSNYNNNKNLVPRDYSKCTHTHIHTRTHTHRHPAHTSILTIQSRKHLGYLEWIKTQGTQNMAGLQFWKKKCFYIIFEWVQRGFLSERKGKVIPCRWTKNRNGAGTNSGESSARNLETESIRSRAESTGGHVKLKTVTEIRWSSACDTFIAESVYLVLSSLLDWKPVEKLKQRCYVVSFCLFFQHEQHSSVCDKGFGQRKQVGQKGKNCSSQSVTEWVRWPVSLQPWWKDTSRQN